MKDTIVSFRVLHNVTHKKKMIECVHPLCCQVHQQYMACCCESLFWSASHCNTSSNTMVAFGPDGMETGKTFTGFQDVPMTAI